MAQAKTVPALTYGAVYLALVCLTGVTILIAGFDAGPLHSAIGLALAALKASLIIAIFMHALQGPKLTWLIVCATLLFLAILLVVTTTDYLSRPEQRGISLKNNAGNSASAW